MCACARVCTRASHREGAHCWQSKAPRLSVESRQKGGLGGGESGSKGGGGREREKAVEDSRKQSEGGWLPRSEPGVVERERETQREKEEQQEGPTGMEKPERGLPWVVEDSVAGGLLQPERNRGGGGGCTGESRAPWGR